MTLFIDEETVDECISIEEAIDVVSEAFAANARGLVVNMPRQRLQHSTGTVRVTGAVSERDGFVGVKVSSSAVFGTPAGRIMTLYDVSTGRLSAVIQVFRLGALRTGALSGVASRALAREDADVLGIVGTGRQARTQVAAIGHVRRLSRIQVYGRDRGHLREFIDDLHLDLEVRACASAEEAVDGADIVVTATSASRPVLFGEWLQPGMHVNAIGANDGSRRELDSAAVARSDLIAVDEPNQARYEASDLITPVEEGIIDWNDVRGIDRIIAGQSEGRKTRDEITLFKSLGTAIADVALAVRVYERALQTGAGHKLPDLTGLVA